MRDQTQRIRDLEHDLAIARLEARTDPMTGLGNRRRYSETIDAWQSRGESFAVVVFDMANLKPANASLGHAGADEVLLEAARHIRAESDLAIRMGGDEFAVLLAGASLEEAAAVRDRIERAFGVLEVAPGVPVFLAGATTRWVAGGADLADLLISADQVLEDRKAQRKAATGEVLDREEALERIRAAR